ncbi:MAG: EutN/CcmL family microcompartment protein [Agathobaculum sp.]|jgi:ethanolamine utilization protein EutN|uniref:EutN/CcmL family microcompartment protein n=1 Tax=Agathobaculum sp. TaxID=2048138 RepID=UPI003D8D0E60
MKIAKVIGNIWATRKEERLAGYKLLIVQPINILDGSRDRTPIVAADTIGAGMGETVIIVGGSSARSAAGDMSVPVDATVVGIVDDKEFDPGILEEKEAVKS